VSDFLKLATIERSEKSRNNADFLSLTSRQAEGCGRRIRTARYGHDSDKHSDRCNPG
jgi:hypothetical protein